ncbi:protein CROWDED NUCLEI 1-like [Canna indica]|uniref:Protein CROWDED NUCLEI 1-like n=1 Tax=Canna indica TaxID=4628 RepID=A0AAQ3JM58_9LILI|nr:protein CROWDED NUCLEI 1-like [Canna indica]
MLAPGKKGWFLSPRATRVPRNQQPSTSTPGNCGGLVPGDGEGGGSLVGDVIHQPKMLLLPLRGDGQDHNEEQSEAEVWRRFGEAGFLDEAVLRRRDREALAQRISELEKELYQYQYHMGLLLIEKKELTAKYEKLRQEMYEAVEIKKRMEAAHIVSISEHEKQEENMRKAMGFQRESIVNLEKALKEMHAETAKVRSEYQMKLSEVRALEAIVEEKNTEVKGKLHSLDARLAEVSRRSTDIDRRLEDVETRELKLHKQSSSFIAKKQASENDLAKKSQDLEAQEQELLDNQKTLAEQHNLLNERENTLKKKEKQLEEAWQTLEICKDSIKLKEDDISVRLRVLHAKEKEAVIKLEMLEKKEKELVTTEEQLSNRERVDIQEIMGYHNSILVSQKEEFELETEKKRRAVDEQLEGRINAVIHKETILVNREREVLKKEQDLERQAGNLKIREDENNMFLNAFKETIENEKEELRQEWVKFEKERELLGEGRLSLEEGLKKLCDEKEKFDQWRHVEEERLKKKDVKVSGHVQMDIEDSKWKEDASTDKTTDQKLNAEILDSENAHAADDVDAYIMQRNQEPDTETRQVEEIDYPRNNITINTCIILSNLDESKIVPMEEHKDQLKKRKADVLGSKNEVDQTTPTTLSHNNKDHAEAPSSESNFFPSPAENLKVCRNWGMKDGEDEIVSGENPEISDRGTCPGSVKPEAQMSCMESCSRLLDFSPDKRTSEHSDKSDCLDGEPLEHEDNLEPGLLLGDDNSSEWAQSASAIQYKRMNKVDNAEKDFLRNLDSPTNILKLNDSPREMREPTLPFSNEQEERTGCFLSPQLIPVTPSLKRKKCDRGARKRSVFVKKARSVNALIEDDNLEKICQSKHDEHSTYEGKKPIPKCLNEGYCYNGDQAAAHAARNDEHGILNTGPEGQNVEAHSEYTSPSEGQNTESQSEDTSSLGCSSEMENSPGTEILGSKRYNFRHSTVVRAVAVSQALACQTKRKEKGGLEQSLKNKVMKIVENDGEEAQRHKCSGENSGHQ